MAEINPSVFIASPKIPSQPKTGINPKTWLLVTLAILVLVLLILVYRGGSFSNVASKTGRNLQTAKPKIILASDKKEYKVGEEVILTIFLSTGGKKTDGTDVILRFDNTALQASSSSVIKGSLYFDYPVASVDQAAGVVRVSGIASSNQTYSGQGVFATVLMKAVKPGKSQITIDYHPGSTTGSNIVGSVDGKQLLEEVGNLEVMVR